MLYYYPLTELTPLAEELSKLNYQSDIFVKTDRDEIYEKKLDLPLKFTNAEFKTKVKSIIKKYIKLDNFQFSVIDTDHECNIHTDAAPGKPAHLQRYCNLAIPIEGDFTRRITYWPTLNNADSEFITKNYYLPKDKTLKYITSENWNTSYRHTKYVPVLLNTEQPHGVVSEGYTLFVYITIPSLKIEQVRSLLQAL